MERLLWICLGGALGSGARYLVSGFALRVLGTGFPFGTLVVNVLGSFLIGALMQIGLSTDWMSPTLRFTVVTGVLGGFTTYSAFSYETMRLIQEGAWTWAALNVAVSVVVCVMATFMGFWLAKSLLGG